MELFSSEARTYSGPLRRGQSSFEWLNESARPECTEGRKIIQAWFDAFPHEHQAKLAHRIRSSGCDHGAAIAELFVHHVLSASGFRVVVDPLTASGSRPDFLIESGEYAAYVEVSQSLETDDDRRIHRAIDELFGEVTARVKTTGFCILVDDVELGHRNPSPKRLADFIEHWFAGFDYQEEVIKAQSSHLALPRTQYRDPKSGWSFEFTLCPLNSPTISLPSIVGSIGFGASWSESTARLRSKLIEKMRQHRDCDHDLIVAIALKDFATEPDKEDIVQVLLGTSHWLISRGKPAETVHKRSANGIWSQFNRQASRRLTGIMLIRNLYPWALECVRAELWDNPLVTRDKHVPVWFSRRYRWDVEGTGQLIISE